MRSGKQGRARSGSKWMFLLGAAAVVAVSLALIAPAAFADWPTPSAINPDWGYRGTTVNPVITGSSLGDVTQMFLWRDDGSLILGAVTGKNAISVNCTINIPSNAALGTWDVVVSEVIVGVYVSGTGHKPSFIPGPDPGTGFIYNGFTIMDPSSSYPEPTVTGITPSWGYVNETVAITDLAGTNFRSGAAVQLEGPSGSADSGRGNIVATDVKVVSSAKVTCSFNLSSASLGKYGVRVTNDDGKSGTKADAFQVISPYSTWYLAEGSTAWGFTTYVSIANPNTKACTAEVTYMTSKGPVSGGNLPLPAKSQTTIETNNISRLTNQDFSTRVACREGMTLSVDRTMIWKGEGAASEEGHASVGVSSPAKVWYLPEGSSAWGFNCYVLVQNPNNKEAVCNFTYMIEGSGPSPVVHKVKPNSRDTFKMVEDIGAHDASVKITSNVPVIPERSMYKNEKREGHESIGTTAPARDYYLAEGSTDHGFETFVLIQNPNSSAADITVTYMPTSGSKQDKSFRMDPNARKTINVFENKEGMPGVRADFSTKVHGSKPIIAERAMYWGEDTPLGEACHDSIGMSSPHKSFYFADGQTSGGKLTYTQVMNPNSSAVEVEITYMTPTGSSNKTFRDTVKAYSRKTFCMKDKTSAPRAAIMVTCRTAGKKIMAERSMYWNSNGAGTNTIGGYSD